MDNIRQKLSIDILKNNNMQGQNITVAVIDTGLFLHLDFMIATNRVIEFFDSTVDMENETNIAYDKNGHGTAVTGVLCGSGLLSNGKYQGIAPKSKIVCIKAINDDGEGDGKNILRGMQYILENASRLNIRVVCMSFGANLTNPDLFIQGVELLWNNGIIVVASIGNDGPKLNTVKSPAASPKIIAVGGIEYNELGCPSVTRFSSRGPYGKFSRPDIVAPSVGIITTNNSGQYQAMSGTSMAAPIIAGICSCILSKYPLYTPDKIKDLLINSTTYVDDNINASGHGLINVIKAVENITNKTDKSNNTLFEN